MVDNGKLWTIDNDGQWAMVVNGWQWTFVDNGHLCTMNNGVHWTMVDNEQWLNMFNMVQNGSNEHHGTLCVLVSLDAAQTVNETSKYYQLLWDLLTFYHQVSPTKRQQKGNVSFVCVRNIIVQPYRSLGGSLSCQLQYVCVTCIYLHFKFCVKSISMYLVTASGVSRGCLAWVNQSPSVTCPP